MNKYVRLTLVLIVCAYFWYYAKTYTDWHFIDNVNLIFHEAGHTIFSFFGMFIHVLMGSGFQVALPLFISLYFFYTSQFISGALTLLWVGQNLLNVSIYAGDAIVMQLPLLGGDNVIHDWNYLLITSHTIRYTHQIAWFIYTLGLFTICMGTVLAVYFCLKKDWEDNKNTPVG